MRRLGPRPLAGALERVTREAAPATALARAQGAWAAAAGDAVARECEPVGERAGVLTVACRSAAWAHELDLMSKELAGRLNDALSKEGGGRPVLAIRFVTRSTAGGS